MCPWSLSSKELSREILRNPKCTCWVSVVRDHPHIVDIFHHFFTSPQPLSSLTDSPRAATINVSFGAFHPVAQTHDISLILSIQRGLRNGHAFDVFALHGVVPHFADCQQPFFSEECPCNDFHVFRRSSRNACSSRSIAVGAARPYLRSDSVWLSASRTRSRFSGA